MDLFFWIKTWMFMLIFCSVLDEKRRLTKFSPQRNFGHWLMAKASKHPGELFTEFVFYDR